MVWTELVVSLACLYFTFYLHLYWPLVLFVCFLSLCEVICYEGRGKPEFAHNLLFLKAHKILLTWLDRVYYKNDKLKE